MLPCDAPCHYFFTFVSGLLVFGSMAACLDLRPTTSNIKLQATGSWARFVGLGTQAEAKQGPNRLAPCARKVVRNKKGEGWGVP